MVKYFWIQIYLTMVFVPQLVLVYQYLVLAVLPKQKQQKKWLVLSSLILLNMMNCLPLLNSAQSLTKQVSDL